MKYKRPTIRIINLETESIIASSISESTDSLPTQEDGYLQSQRKGIWNDDAGIWK